MRMEEKMDLEKEVIDSVQEAIRTSIKEHLCGYNSPLQKIVDEAVKVHDKQIREVVYLAVSSTVSSNEFKEEMRTAFAHTVARQLVADFSKSLAAKATEAVKCDQVLRARAVSAVEDILREAPGSASKA